MADHAKTSPWPKRIGFALLAIVSLFLVALLCLWLWVRSDAGRDFVETTIEEMDVAGQRVAIDGLSGSLLGSFAIEEVTLTGRDGVWLVARDVTVDWSPRAILSKTLDIDDLRIGDLDLLQRPVWVPSGSDGEARITTFEIDGIALPDVFVAEAVMGRDVQLFAQGRLTHGPEGGDAVMTAQSDQGDVVNADLEWSPLLVLSGEADVTGPADGLIARLLRLDSGQGVTAQISTEDQQTQVSMQIDGAELADLSIRRSQSQIALTGTVEPDRLPLLDPAAQWLGGTTELDAIWPLDQGAGLTVSLQAPKLVLNATGQQEEGTLILDQLTVSASTPLDGLGRDDVSVATLTAQGQARIGETYSFSGQIAAQTIQYQNYQIDRLAGPSDLRFEEGVLSFSADLTGRASQSPAERADGAKVGLAGTYDFDSRTIALSRASIDLPGLLFRGQGQIPLDDPEASTLSGRYNVDSALFFESPAARLRGDVTIRRTASGSVVDVTGRARNFANVPDVALPLTGDGIDYTARLRLGGGVVTVPRLRVGNDQFEATGTARWSDGRLQADIAYSSDRYEFAALAMDDVSGKATLNGPPRKLSFDTQLTATTLSAGGLVMNDASIDATGDYADGVIQADGSVDARSEQGPVSVRGSVLQDSGAWRVTDLDGTLGALRSTGTLSGVGGDLSALRADLILSGSTPFIPAEKIEGRILLGDAQVDLDVMLSTMVLGPIDVEQLHLLAKGPREAVAFDIDAAGMTRVNELDRPLGLSATGLADLRSEAVSARAGFDLGVGTQSLTGDLSVAQSVDGWAGTVDATGLGGGLAAALVPGPEGGFRIDLDSINVPALARLLARPATEGTLSGTGRFKFVGTHIEGQTELTLNDLRSPISQAAPVSVRMQATLAGERLTALMEATEGGLSGQSRIEGEVRTFTRAPYLEWPPAVPLQGVADLRGEVGPLVEIFLPPRTDVAGRIASDVSFTVPPTPTGLQGRIALSEGVFEQGALGLRLRDITIVAELSGETITVPTLSAEGVDGGRLSGSGRMGIGEGTGTVDIQATRLRVIERGEGQAEVSGELTLSRTDALLRLAGELRVTDADINIARLPKPGLPTLDVDFGDRSSEEETRSFASATTELDVTVVSENRVKVRGRGLNANMGLDARIRGAFDNPVVTGEMTIDRGRFDFLGKRFELRDSSILLRDDILQSVLALEAIRQTSDLTAIVQVTGTIERPEIELTAEPTLPEDEVLSRVLFGRSPTQLSAIETARLAAALTQLSGGSGFDLFGNLEDAVGLDTLEINQNETGQTQLTTGKYLSDDVYLEVRTAAEGTPGIAVEWQVRDNISLEAETQPNERQRLSVQWKRDFD